MELRDRITGEAAHKKPWLSMVRYQPHFYITKETGLTNHARKISLVKVVRRTA